MISKDIFSNKNVITIGDCMLDIYNKGEIKRISPEAPIPIFNKTSSFEKLGGAANVAKSISFLNSHSTLIAGISNDISGQRILELCAEFGVNFIPIYFQKRPTTTKTRYVAKSQHILRVDDESSLDIAQDEVDKILELLIKEISEKKIDSLILQDYNKGLLTPLLIKNVIKVCEKNDILTLADPKWDNIESYSGVDVLKPNLGELSKILGYEILINEDNLHSAVSNLKNIVDFKECYVTLGSEGVYSYKKSKIYTGPKNEIIDVTGAGDSVITCLSLIKSYDLTEKEICDYINLFGFITCTKLGTYSPTIKDLEANKSK